MTITPFLVAILAYYALIAGLKANEQNVASKVVKIESGSVRGYILEDFNIYAFYGVPYATAPSGPNKFKAPLPAPVWFETLDAADNSIVCNSTIDNCLIANIYVPDTQETNIPVVIYVHGGAYLIGYGNIIQPKSLVQNGNIIGVNFNYRLGVEGFLCLGTEDVPGNAGMKDQVALLKWVKNNIASFGGNPDDITIAGYSAGASSVELLAVSKMAQGLFNKIIPESGAAISVWSIQQDPIGNAKHLAESLNFKTDNVSALEEFYKNYDVKKLNYDVYFVRPDSTFGFSPCIERETGTEAFLGEAPVTILKKKEFKKLPMLIGFANMEGIFRLNLFGSWKDKMNEKFSNYLPADLKFKSKREREEVAEKIKKFYFGDEPVSEKNMPSYINYFNDILFAYPILKTVRLQEEAGNNQIYLYEYSFVEDPLIENINLFKVKGADHIAQSIAVQESSIFGIDAVFTESHKQMKEIMKQLWTNFIKTGKPVPEITAIFPEGWRPFAITDSLYMSLNIPPVLKKCLLEERFAFWDEIYGKYLSIPSPVAFPTSLQ